MRYIALGVSAVFLFISLTGCAELKQLRVETADQKARIARLDSENRSCRDDLKNTREDLRRTENELKTREGELKKVEGELKVKETQVKEQSDAYTRMQDAMKAELDSRQVALKELEGRLTLTMVESILFDSGKADVKEEGVNTLKKVAEVLKGTSDQEIAVAGYTDNVQIIGRLAKTYATNWELSAARAISVVKILAAQGVDNTLLSATGYSEYRPVADNDTPEGRAQNRRMEIILMPKRKQ